MSTADDLWWSLNDCPCLHNDLQPCVCPFYFATQVSPRSNPFFNNIRCPPAYLKQKPFRWRRQNTAAFIYKK